MSKFRTFYSSRPLVVKDIFTSSKTEQSHKISCDINVLVNRYKKTGVVSDPSMFRDQYYGDFSNLPDMVGIATSRARIAQYFEGLPSSTREAFLNDPDRFINAWNDPAQSDLLAQFGFIKKAPLSDLGTPANPGDVIPSKELQESAAQ